MAQRGKGLKVKWRKCEWERGRRRNNHRLKPYYSVQILYHSVVKRIDF
jgi:hypothetical protein